MIKEDVLECLECLEGVDLGDITDLGDFGNEVPKFADPVSDANRMVVGKVGVKLGLHKD
ncbi:MAG: hypothetical protein OEL89_05415 [Candidatus Peregrinibacteria bacterium]|nr:hypothetical protein [Candidatus Peregrinibacteria bacterium]